MAKKSKDPVKELSIIEKINNASKSVFSGLDKIREIEKSLKDSGLNFLTVVEIDSEGDDADGTKYLSWEYCKEVNSYRVFFKGNVVNKNGEEVFLIRKFIETQFHIRLRYVKYLHVLVDKILLEAKKFQEKSK